MSYKKLKQIVDFLGTMAAVPWDLAIPNLHEICMPYLMQSDIPVKERKWICGKLTTHLRFLSILTRKKQIAKDLLAYYSHQVGSLKNLLDTNYGDWGKGAL